ncbi:MAG TPA: RsmG family class I SAM-dependent methyltransferase [Myxococcota bacterium]|nr:RsmG family class I SAM-dependent methyltransferase [Myxococcota bacterium]
MAEGLGSLEGLAAQPASSLEALAALAILVERWSQRMNLTGHRTGEQVVRHLILDAAALDAALPQSIESLVDLGSGLGFPGLPLAILHPERKLLLVESRERRHHFQRLAIRELGLENVEARRGRAESLSPTPHDAGVAQAVARPRAAALLLLPWVRPDGWLIIPGGSRGPVIGPLPGVESERILHYQVPLGGPRRSIWLGRKERSPLDGRQAGRCDT